MTQEGQELVKQETVHGPLYGSRNESQSPNRVQEAGLWSQCGQVSFCHLDSNKSLHIGVGITSTHQGFRFSSPSEHVSL